MDDTLILTIVFCAWGLAAILVMLYFQRKWSKERKGLIYVTRRSVLAGQSVTNRRVAVSEASGTRARSAPRAR